MFTGLIEAVALASGKDGASLRIDLAALDEPVAPGDSIAVSGVCLTAAGVSSGICTFDISGETSSRTTLGGVRGDEHVNIERALKMSDRIGGHFVTGHIDGVGVIEKVTPETLDVSLPAELKELVVEKGSVAVDGISLTVASLTSTGFTAAIVPFTYEHTCLKHRKRGDRANIETDVLGKYVKQLMNRESGGISMADLEKHGFTSQGRR
jgi:riboflavin synthase